MTLEKSKTKYWIYFLISTVACLLLLWFLPAWFWVVLPFVLTYLVLALDII